MKLEPEKDRWRMVARDWYAEGVAGTPGHGKLHHHLGHLSCEAEGEELGGATSLRSDVFIYLTPGPVINQLSTV